MLKLIGTVNLTSDPTTGDANGTPYTSFGIAANTRRNGPDGKPIPNFFNATVFSQAREACAKFLKSGDKIQIVGELVLRPYTNKEGQKVYSHDVTISEVEFIKVKSFQDRDESNGTKTTQTPPMEKPAPKTEQVDELPF